VAAIPGARRLLAEVSIGCVGGSTSTGSSLLATGFVLALLAWGAMAAASSET